MNSQSKITVTVAITKHAYNRGKERVGLNAKAFETLVLKAYISGKKHSEAKGQLKDFISKLYLQYRTANNTRIYGGHIYLFSDACLITVYHLPNELKKYIKL